MSSLTFNPSPAQVPCVLQRREMCPHLNHYGVHCVNCHCQPNQLLQSPFFIVSLCNLQICIPVLLKLQNQLRVQHMNDMVYKFFCCNIMQYVHQNLFVHPYCVHNINQSSQPENPEVRNRKGAESGLLLPMTVFGLKFQNSAKL